MSISSAVRILRQTIAFGGLGDDRLNVLAFSSDRLRFAVGERIVSPNETPARCLVVLEGRALVGDRDKGAGRSVGAGATIGESALITNQPISFAITGETAGEMLVITRPLFERMIEDFPDMAVYLRDAMRARLGDTLRRLSSIERKLRQPVDIHPDRGGPAPAHDRMAGPSPVPRRPR